MDALGALGAEAIVPHGTSEHGPLLQYSVSHPLPGRDTEQAGRPTSNDNPSRPTMRAPGPELWSRPTAARSPALAVGGAPVGTISIGPLLIEAEEPVHQGVAGTYGSAGVQEVHKETGEFGR